MAEEAEDFIIPEQLAEVKDIGAPRATNFNTKISESALEAAKNIPQLPVAPNGIFRHPNTWTEEEDAIIARGIKAHLPLQVIGTKVNCERGTLSKHIKNTPELAALFEDAKEDFVDRAEYQIDRLMQAGNAAAVMFTLERMGRKRGWGQQEYIEQKGEDDIIQFTPIPESEIQRADSIRKEMGAVEDDQVMVGQIPVEETKVFESDPLKQEMVAEQAADDIQAQKEAEAQTPKPVETARVSPPPYEEKPQPMQTQQSVDDDAWGEDGFEQTLNSQSPGDDDFSGGEFSPFGSM